MKPTVFETRQFRAGNSQAVRLPANMAFPPKTELIVKREKDRIIIEPKTETLERIIEIFSILGEYHSGERPVFEDEKRDWA